MRKIIFVGGIHGVGKTTFCSELSIKHNLLYFSASKLISRLKKEGFNKNKRIKDIEGNQDILLKALDIYIPREEWILLDGHFTLLNKEGTVTRIPFQTFEDLRPSAILILVDEISEISTHLRNRDNLNLDKSFLEDFQKEERAYAVAISNKLKVPFFIYREQSDTEELHTFINSVFSTSSQY